MLSYVARRLLYSVPALFVATFGLFWAVRSTFDPAAKFTASRDPTALARFKAKWGLDDPIPTQYWRWLKNFLQGDWGISTATNDNVSSMIWRSFGVTLQLIIWGMLFAAVVSMALGVFSAVRQYSAADYALTGLSYVGIAVPPFVFGLLAIQVLGVMLKNWLGLDAPLFPFVGLHTGNSSGFNLDYLRHLVLPVLTLTVQIVASWSRFQRAAMLDVMSSDYVRTARAKGVPRRQVVLRHGFRNALIPLVTVMAVDSGALFGGL
ncbi:MAG: ABC transporter permease, partial [Acidimicrobiia bacterium]|nr:ABC transporter permease [Acidimicrobiia bacterium]